MIKEYEEFCKSTVHHVKDKLQRVQSLGEFGLSLTGLAGEFGKLLHLHRRFVCYGDPLPDEQVHSCLAGILWYLTRLCATRNATLEDIMKLSQKEAKMRHTKKEGN